MIQDNLSQPHRELDPLLDIVRNTALMPEFRVIDRYISPSIRRVIKACDQIEHLARTGRIAADQVPKMVNAGATGSDHVSGSIGIAIAYIGPSAVPHLDELLGHPNRDVGTVTSIAIGRIGPFALDTLERAIYDDRKRSNAAVGLVHMGSPAIPTLTRLLQAHSEPVRRAAAFCLANLDSISANH